MTPSGDQTGVTDDANVAAAFATMAANTNYNNPVNHVLTLAPGAYYSQQKNVFTFANTTAQNYLFQGYGAVITQTASNVGMWEFQLPLGGINNTIRVKGITFQYATQQTSANTASVCLGFRAVADPATNQVFFGFTVEECKFTYGFRGVGCTQPTGTMGAFYIQIKGNQYSSIAGASNYLVTPTAIGWTSINISDNLTIPSGGPPSEAMDIVANCDNLTMFNNEYDGGSGQPAIFLNGVASFATGGSKAESFTTSGTNGLIELLNSSGTIISFHANGIICNGGYLLTQNTVASNSCYVNILDVGISMNSGTGTFTLFATAPNSQFNVMSAPNITGLGSGPAVVRLTNSGGSASANKLHLLSYPGGEMSDDIGDASLTWTGFSPAVFSASSAHCNVWNSPLTAPRTVTLTTGIGNSYADNFWDGCECHVIRTANSNDVNALTVNGSIPASKTYATGTWGKWKWRRSLGWVETEGGSL